MSMWVENFLGKYFNGFYIPSIGFTDVLEILIISIIVYEVMLWIKNT